MANVIVNIVVAKLNPDITPNEFKTYKERLANLKKLAFEFTKAIDNGWLPHR